MTQRSDPGFLDLLKDSRFQDGYETGFDTGFEAARNSANFIVTVGNPADGYSYYGPFSEEADAQAYIDSASTDGNPAWIVALERPFKPLPSDAECRAHSVRPVGDA